MRSIFRTSETYALALLRRSLLIVAINYGYFLLLFALWRRGSELPPLTIIVIFGGLCISTLAAPFAKRENALRTMIVTLFLVTLYLVLDPFVTINWMQLSVLVAIISLAIVFLQWKGKIQNTILLISLLALFNFLAYYFEAISLLRSGSFLGRGTISSLMILSTGSYAAYGWRRMVQRADFNDLRMKTISDDIENLEKSQESQKIWRELVVRVHETTLNTIRSLITLKDVPIETLRRDIESSISLDKSLMNRAQERRSGSLIGSIRAGIDGAAPQEKVRIVSQGVNLHLDAAISDVVERVVREALRNSIEHAKAKNIEINWRTTTVPSSGVVELERGRIYLTISDDGKVTSPQNQGGIGTNLVMAKGIRELGGTFHIESNSEQGGSGTVVRVELPNLLEPQQLGSEDLPLYKAADLGSYMALLTLFGPAMTGVFFLPLLGIWWPGHFASQSLGVLSLAYLIYATFVRMKRLGWIESVLVSLGLLGIVHFLKLDPLTCVDAQPFQWVINSTVYGLFIVLLWGKPLVVAIAYPLFLYRVEDFHNLIPQDCNFIFNFPIMNTLFSFLFVAVIFALVYKIFERVEKNQKRKFAENAELLSEVQRSDQSFERILELDTYAKKTITELASGVGLLSPESQTELRRIDSQLRAEIQVDPVSSSGLTLLARDFINKAVSGNHWMDVKSIHGDEDSRPIPELVRERFLALARDIKNGTPIQVIAGEQYAELSINLSAQLVEDARELERSIEAIKSPGLSGGLKKVSEENFIFFIRREKASQ